MTNNINVLGIIINIFHLFIYLLLICNTYERKDNNFIIKMSIVVCKIIQKVTETLLNSSS